jgi:ATP-dependent DNA helicase RecQ
MIDQTLYFDLETDRDGTKVLDVGAVQGLREYHRNDWNGLQQWAGSPTVICGHNIVDFDLPLLERKYKATPFPNAKRCDTLLLSPLLFAQKPYHKLIKDYKLNNEDTVNDPVADSKLSRDLLAEEVDAFACLPAKVKAIYFLLLHKLPGFDGFFDRAAYNYEADATAVNLLLREQLYGQYCSTANLQYLITTYPVELAYAIALMQADQESVSAPWLIKSYPNIKVVLKTLRFTPCKSAACNYCETKLAPKAALKAHFGYDDFRKFEGDDKEGSGLQELTVHAALEQKSLLAVFPTGGGKSLTFQLPALMQGELQRELTVVISPLVSLMKDQVDVLQRRHNIVGAVYINSLLSPLEREENIKRVEEGGAHLLYISPESLRSPGILRLLEGRAIARFVIDEAHCFSAWGQDFRVDYLYIGDFIKELLQRKGSSDPLPISCFTATAKPQVVSDIKAYFKDRLGLELGEYITRAGRTNLHYQVVDVEDDLDKDRKLLRILNSAAKPVIIYASRTKAVERITELLKSRDFDVTGFHGKMKTEVKIKNMDDFMSDRKDVVVATSAFGMGVDKSDVKTVIHYDISDSLENYMQEAGRGGRDPKIRAECFVFYNKNDLNKHFSLLQQTKINLQEINDIWKSIKKLTRFRSNVSQSALEMAKHAGWDIEVRQLDNRVTGALAALEDQGFLKRTQNSPRVFADSLVIKSVEEANRRIREAEGISEVERLRASRVVQRIVKEDECRVEYLAHVLDLTVVEAQESIALLRQINILSDHRDLTAFIDKKSGNSRRNSKRVLREMMSLESAMIKTFTKQGGTFALRQLSQKLQDELGVEHAHPDKIMLILTHWEIRNHISKKRKERADQVYEIRFKEDLEKLVEGIAVKHELSISCLDFLSQNQEKQKLAASDNRNEELPVEFSQKELKDHIEGGANGFFASQSSYTTKDYVDALLYLNHVKSIQLEGGFMIYYKKLNVKRLQKENRKQFTRENYSKLENYYDQRTQQIHIVGSYAERCLKNYDDALRFTDDYFQLDHKTFINKYFPDTEDRDALSRALTPERFQQLYGALSTEQFAIVQDRSRHIMVAAGPGSGKTRVLVHKIASLLLLEDVKPEQFIMLTFSRAAVLEFRDRIWKLVPELARYIQITTFHSFCFSLLGQLGNLEKSEDVVKNGTKALLEGEVDTARVANKSVLVIDEFQDVNADELALIKAISTVAENLRIIAVGDDDQCIYEFRGADPANMWRFKDEFETSYHSLLTNYRSMQGIVKFNNSFAKRIGRRLKEEEDLISSGAEEGQVSIRNYSSSNLIVPAVEQIVKSPPVGSCAVLTKTNEEALLVVTMLKAKGYKARLIQGNEGFRLSMLDEMRQFTKMLESDSNELGLITTPRWEKAQIEFESKFSKSPHYEAFCEIILLFGNHHVERKLTVDWNEFLREIRFQDAVKADDNSIVVSTMHKAKGKEFDEVHVVYDDFNLNSDESKRLAYVAMSRAKQRLVLYTNGNQFPQEVIDDVLHFNSEETFHAPAKLEFILSLKDVNLGSQKYNRTRIESLSVGEALFPHVKKFEDNEAPGLKSSNGGEVMLLGNKHFVKPTYNRLKAKGYQCGESSVEYLVYWYDKETEKEVKVVLPRLVMEKVKSE